MKTKEVIIVRPKSEPEWRFLERTASLCDRPHIIKSSYSTDGGEYITQLSVTIKEQ